MDDMRLNYFTNDESFPFFIQYGTHDENMFLHGHEDFYELVVVLEGDALHIVNDESYEIRKGDVFVIGKGINHGYNNPKNFRICNIMFRPESLLSGDYDVKQSAGFHSLFLLDQYFNSAQGFKSRLKLSPSVFGKLENLIDTAINEYTSTEIGKKTLLFSYFMQIAVELSRAYESSDSTVEISSIANAAAYMESNYMEDIPIEKLLEISHYSQRHFIRLFSELYLTTPKKYLLGIRIRRACALLRDSNMKITEVAFNCGFNDSNYFSRIFKKYTNVTPNGYRERFVT